MKLYDVQYATCSYCWCVNVFGNHSAKGAHPTVDGGFMNLIDLEAFVSVVDHGSIVAAAAALHLTQSAVTRRVQSLEDMLGVSLLDRQTRPLQPTLAGRETYEFARPVLSSVSDLKAAITQNGEPSGKPRESQARRGDRQPARRQCATGVARFRTDWHETD